MKFFATRISENMAKTPEGFLICFGVPIARTGEMEYSEAELEGVEGLEGDENGVVLINRDAKEVFDEKTISSFEGKPFTIGHPSELVTPKNWKRYASGVLRNVRASANKTDLISDVIIMDAEAIALVESEGVREVSCGYEADYEATGRGRGRQSNITGNHLALVDQGRAGSGYAINDHKGVNTMDFKKMFAVFAKDPEAIKAMKALTADGKGKKGQQDDDDEDDDDDGPALTNDSKAIAKVLSKLTKTVDAMNATVANMAQPTAAAADEGEEEQIPKWAQALISRIAALEKSAKPAGDEDVVMDDESEEDVVSEDAADDDDDDEGEETTDQGAMTVISGDAALRASRAEILAPGLELDAKDKHLKVKALKACFATKDGKKIIGALNRGKTPVWTDAKAVDSLFISVSEVLKAQRTRKNSKTKFADAELIDGTPESKVMTAEKINEMNAKHYSRSH